MAECWFRFGDVLVGFPQIEETSRVFGVNGAGDREAAAFSDRYFVGVVHHHRIRRGQGKPGRLQLNCGIRDTFWYKVAFHLDNDVYDQTHKDELVTSDCQLSGVTLRVVDHLIGYFLLIFTEVRSLLAEVHRWENKGRGFIFRVFFHLE